jgi:fluoroquinolone resistance protein
VITVDDIKAKEFFEAEDIFAIDLHEVSLSGKEFDDCTFRQVKLQESRLGGLRLSDCRFEDCDLTAIHPQGMKAQQVHFARCKMVGVQWSELAQYPQVEFHECQLRYATFLGLDLRRARFIRCDIREATFLRMDLTEADFDGSDLTGTKFEDCQLRKADFTAATGAWLDPANNRVKDARISLESAALVALSFGMCVEGIATQEPLLGKAGKERKSTRRG